MKPCKKTFDFPPPSVFIEAGSGLLKENGLLSYIIPAVLHNQHYFSKIRKFLLEQMNIDLIHLFKYRVFDNAETGDTLIFVSTRAVPNKSNIVFRTSNSFSEPLNWAEGTLEKYSANSNQRYELTIGSGNTLVSNIIENSIPLGTIANCVMGDKTLSNWKRNNKTNQEYGFGKTI